MRPASVPASGRQASMAPQVQTQPGSWDDIVQVHLPQLSDNNSQPAVAGRGAITFSPPRSDDTFGPSQPASQDSVLRNDSPPGSDQQQGDAQQGRIPALYFKSCCWLLFLSLSCSADAATKAFQRHSPRRWSRFLCSYQEIGEEHPHCMVVAARYPPRCGGISKDIII
jgi:hypothetical protein